MPRGIPNSRAQHTSEELADDLGVHDSYEHEDSVLDMMSPNADAMANAVRYIEPVTSLGFVFDKELPKELGGGMTSPEYEAFMQEPVEIKLHQSTDKNAPWAVFVGINGDNRWLPRGVALRIQRKFVERLAQSQERTFETKDNPDPAADVGKTVLSRQANPYEFSVLRDPNPKGRRWLANMLRQGS